MVKTVTDFVASGSFASLRENVKYYDSPNYAILVRTKDFQSNFTNGLVYTDRHGYEFLENSNLFGGELILPNIGASIGKVFLVPKLNYPMTLAPNSIMVKCWDEVTLIWLYFYFLSTSGQNALKNISSSTAQGKFNKTDFKGICIPVPPLNEQQRIVNQIFSIETTLSVIEHNEDLLKESIKFIKSKILDLAMQGKLVPQDPADEAAADMLRRINHKAKIIGDNPHYPQLPENWVLTTIDSICLYRNGKTIPVSDINAEDWVLELEDVESYTGRLLQIKSKKERAISGTRHSFKSGDILFSRLRTYLNKVLLSTKDGFCSTEIIPITPFKCVIPEYLYYWLRSSLFVEYTISCGYGVKMPRLSTSDANKAIVPLPPLKEQKCIVEIIQKFQSGLDKISNSLS